MTNKAAEVRLEGIGKRYGKLIYEIEKRGVEFAALPDLALEAQISYLEVHIQARRRWLATARHARSVDELDRWWKDKFRELDRR